MQIVGRAWILSLINASEGLSPSDTPLFPAHVIEGRGFATGRASGCVEGVWLRTNDPLKWSHGGMPRAEGLSCLGMSAEWLRSYVG